MASISSDSEIGKSRNGFSHIEISNELLIKDFGNPILSTNMSIYPSLNGRLLNSRCLTNRAILAPTTDVVNQINEYIYCP